MLKNPITANSRNPLQRRRALTPEEYARLHSAAQSKAAWLLQDHHADLEDQMAKERAELEGDIDRLSKDMKPLANRVRDLNNRKSRLVCKIRVAVSEVSEVAMLEGGVKGVATELTAVREACALMREELAEAQIESAKLRARIKKLNQSNERRKADLEMRLKLSDGGQRLLDAADEVDQLRKRKAAAKAGATNASVSA